MLLNEKTTWRSLIVLACTVALIPGDTVVWATPQAPPTTESSGKAPAKIPADQLDSLVAPIALYPDPLLAQTLAASTYPLELIQLQQWLANHKGLKDKELADAVAKESWDPSVQALAALPDVANRLANDIQWTTDLGNAFLAQETDVMDAVQRMRKKAYDKGTLKTTEQQTVAARVVEKKDVIVIEQAKPEVIYVPSYDPIVVWGPAYYYPYPPIYYPTGYYAAGMALSFGMGVMMGAFWSGGWGWGCGWGGNNVYINHNNNFNRNGNINRGNLGNRPSQLPSGGLGNRGNLGNRASQLPANGRSNWQHNPEHRGGAPYRDRATADRFGGTARGDSLANRQAGARQQISRQGGALGSNRGLDRGAGAGQRTGGQGFGGGGGGGGADRIGSRDLSRSGGGNRDAFGGGSRGFDGSSARASSNRGASSMGSRGGGGGFRGGGGGRRR